MAYHFKYGGSTNARTMHCAGWRKLADTLPPADTAENSPDAARGTLLHDAAECIFMDAAEIPIADKIAAHSRGVDKADIVEALTPAIEATEALMDELNIAEYVCEPLVKVSDIVGGSIDLLGVSADSKKVLILDYKFGYHGVEAEANDQLLFYAVCAANDPDTADFFAHAEEVELVIVQPANGECTPKTWTVGMDFIDDYETRLHGAIKIAESDTPPLGVGAGCKYCPAKPVCPEKTGAAVKISRLTDLQVDQLATFLPLAYEMEDWAKSVKKLAHEQMELGVKVDGYKLVNKRSRRVWNDAEAVESMVRKAKKIKLTDGFTTSLKSPAQLEKVCKDLGVDFEKYKKYISSVSSGTTLATSDSKTPEALPLNALEQLNSLLD